MNSFAELARDIQDGYKQIRPNDYATAAISIRIPALADRTLIEAFNGDDGEAVVRQYIRNAIGKFS